MKKSISRLGVGKPIDEHKWDYSHLLSEKMRRTRPGLKITVHTYPDTKKINAFAHDEYHDEPIVVLEASKHENKIRLGFANVEFPEYQGEGIGKTLYEAILAHANNHLGITHVTGEEHSTTAHQAHQFIKRKHGTKYFAKRNTVKQGGRNFVWPNTEDWEASGGYSFDDRYQGYQYTIDPSAKLKKALANIQHGGLRADDSSPVEYYDYSHLLPREIRNKYQLEVRDRHPQVTAEIHNLNDNAHVGAVEGVIKRNDALHVVASLVGHEHTKQGLGTAAYEALLAHTYNKYHIEHVEGAAHTAAAHNRHKAIAAKHGLTYSSTQGEDGKYTPYHYSLKHEFEQLAFESPLIKTDGVEDPVAHLLKHGSVAERLMALKMNEVTEQHLLMAMKDRSAKVQSAIMEHPKFGAGVIREAPQRWLVKQAPLLLMNFDRSVANAGVDLSSDELGTTIENGGLDQNTVTKINDDVSTKWASKEAVDHLLTRLLSEKPSHEDVEWLRSLAYPIAYLGNDLKEGLANSLFDRSVNYEDETEDFGTRPEIAKLLMFHPTHGHRFTTKMVDAFSHPGMEQYYDLEHYDVQQKVRAAEISVEQATAIHNYIFAENALRNYFHFKEKVSSDIAEAVMNSTNMSRNIEMHLNAAKHVSSEKLNPLLRHISTMKDADAGLDKAIEFISDKGPGRGDGIGDEQINSMIHPDSSSRLLYGISHLTLSDKTFNKYVNTLRSVADAAKIRSDEEGGWGKETNAYNRLRNAGGHVVMNATPERFNGPLKEMFKEGNPLIAGKYAESLANRFIDANELINSKDASDVAHGEKIFQDYQFSTDEVDHLSKIYKNHGSVEKYLAFFPNTSSEIWKKHFNIAVDNGKSSLALNMLKTRPSEITDYLHNSDFQTNLDSELVEFMTTHPNPKPEWNEVLDSKMGDMPSYMQGMIIRKWNPEKVQKAFQENISGALGNTILEDQILRTHLEPKDFDDYLARSDKTGFNWNSNATSILNTQKHITPEQLLSILNTPTIDDDLTRSAYWHPNCPTDLVMAKLGPDNLAEMHDRTIDIYQKHPDVDFLSHPKIKKEYLDKVLDAMPQGAFSNMPLIGHLLENSNLDGSHIQRIYNGTGNSFKLIDNNHSERTRQREWRKSVMQILQHPNCPASITDKLWKEVGLDGEVSHKGWNPARNTPILDYNSPERRRLEESLGEVASVSDFRNFIFMHRYHNNPEALYGQRKIMVRPNTQKFRVMRDLILDSGQEAVPMNQLPSGNWEPFRIKTGDPKTDKQRLISSNIIQQKIDNAPGRSWYWDADKIFNYGLQQHTGENSKVFSLNISPDIIDRLKKEGLWAKFRQIQKKCNHIHPQHNSNSIGWVRWTGDPKATKTCHMDEIQSDIALMPTELDGIDHKHRMWEGKYPTWNEVPDEEKAEINAKQAKWIKDNKESLEEEAKLKDILFDGEDPHQLLIEGFHGWIHQQFGRVRIHWPGKEMRATLSNLEGYDLSGTGIKDKNEERPLNELDRHISALRSSKLSLDRHRAKPVPNLEVDPIAHRRHMQTDKQLEDQFNTKNGDYQAVKQKVIDFLKKRPAVKKYNSGTTVGGSMVTKLDDKYFMREASTKYDTNYEKLPAIVGASINAAAYGDEPSETNLDLYGGMPMHISLARKKEEAGIGEILTKSLADIPGGKIITSGRSFSVMDMSHLLSQQLRHEGYELRLSFSHPHSEGYITADIKHKGNFVGGLTSFVTHKYRRLGDPQDSRDLELELSDVEDGHQGKGLGSAAYEGAMAIARNVFQCTHVRGTSHSSLAAKVHAGLAAKHKLSYLAEPNIGGTSYPDQRTWEDKPTKGFDSKFKNYRYTLKAELDPNPSSSDKWLNNDGMSHHVYNYSHVMPMPFKDNRSYKLFIKRHGHNLSASVHKSDEVIGEAHGIFDSRSGDFITNDVLIHPEYKGAGLRTAMKKALGSHAVNAFKVKLPNQDSEVSDQDKDKRLMSNKRRYTP